MEGGKMTMENEVVLVCRVCGKRTLCPLVAAKAILLSHGDTIIAVQGPKEDSHCPHSLLSGFLRSARQLHNPAPQLSLTVSVFTFNLLQIFGVFSLR